MVSLSSGCSVFSYNSTGTEGSNISYCRSLLKGSFHYSKDEEDDESVVIPDNEEEEKEEQEHINNVPKSQSLFKVQTHSSNNNKVTPSTNSTSPKQQQPKRQQYDNDDDDDVLVIIDEEDDDITNYDIFQGGDNTPGKEDDYSISTHLTTPQYYRQQQQQQEQSAGSSILNNKESATTEPPNTTTTTTISSTKTQDTEEDSSVKKKKKKKNPFKTIVKRIIRPFLLKNKTSDDNNELKTLIKPSISKSSSSLSKRKRFDTATSTTLTATSSTQDLIGTVAATAKAVPATTTTTTTSPVLITDRSRNTSSSVTFQEDDEMLMINNNNTALTTAATTTTTTAYTKQQPTITPVIEDEKKDEDATGVISSTSAKLLDPIETTTNSSIITMEWLGGEKHMFPITTEYDAICTIYNQLSYDEQQTIYTRDWTIPIRHYRAEKGHIDKAVNQIKKSLAWRKEFGVDEINECWGPVSETDPHHELYTMLGEENRSGTVYVRGYDKEGRALMYMTPGREWSFNEIRNMKHLVWNLEKAIACTRRKSFEVTGRKLEKVNLLIDYDGFRIKDHAPPLSTTKYTLEILQKHYPERMFHVYFLHAPSVFRIFWTCIKSFVDTNTKEKIVFCSGSYGLRYLTDNVTDLHKLETRSGYEPLPSSSNSKDENDENDNTNNEVRPFDSKVYQLLPRNIAYDE